MTIVDQGIRVDRRWLILIPVASLMYMMAFLDRTNISFVLPFMGDDLGLTATDKGLVNGIFFVGYLILQVPAAMLAQRWNAKWTVLILMVLWGLASIACGLVETREQMLVARFILGVFEGGVQPATLVLLASWFSQRERARANGFWLLCLPLSSLIASPLTGWLLSFLEWRMVLVLEGLPPLIWAVVWFFVIQDSPRRARWLQAGVADRVEKELVADEAAKPNAASARYRDVLTNPKVWALTAFWFLFNGAFYGFTLWLPTVVSTLSGGSAAVVGWLTAIPYGLAVIGMIVIATTSDRLGSRRWPVALPVLISAVALLVGQFIHQPVLQFVLLCVVAATLYIHGPFLALPAVILPASLLGLALGLINGIGNLGGFFGPYIVGALIDQTGSEVAGFILMSIAFVAAAVIVLFVAPRRKSTAEPATTEELSR